MPAKDTPMTRRLVVFGASGHASVVCDLATEVGFESFTILDDRFSLGLTHPFGAVEGPLSAESIARFVGSPFVVAVGNCRVRESLFRRGVECGLEPVTLVHPHASVSRTAELAAGTVVLAGAVVAAFARAGAASIINHGAVVDHDCRLDSAVHICPGATLSGGVSVGARSWVGVGASVRQLVSIGSDVTIGAGAAVVRNVDNGQTVVGVPARPMRSVGNGSD
jgi:sugar O-acyltransferase (sialic acid O-acetyltransferase NeuD family)